jgi:DNA polymerase III epsilon subunit family exonuclease
MQVNIRPKQYIVVDIETTGFSHFKDDIIEIGAVKYDDGKELDRLSLLLKTDKKLTSDIIRITGITNEMLDAHGVEPKDAILAFKDFCEDSILIGHNFTSFDSKFIEDAYQKYLGEDLLNDFVDTLSLAKEVYPNMQKRSLGDLANLYGVDYSKAHRATEDCIINHQVYEYMAFGNLIEASNDNNLDDEELEEADLSEEWLAKINEILTRYVDEHELPNKSLCIMANRSRKTKEITSHSVIINEPPLIQTEYNQLSRSDVVVRIQKKSFKTKEDVFSVTPKCLPSLETIDIPGDTELHKDCIYFPLKSMEFYNYIIQCAEYALINYKPRQNSFACCSRFEECSAEGKCIHPNKLASRACAYRKNLEAGNIFF